MNINDLKEMCDKDTKIDETDLDGYSMSIPEKANKYHQLAFIESKTLRFLEAQYRTARLSRWLYYSGKAPEADYEDKPFDLKVLKSDLDIFLDADEKLMELQEQIAEQTGKMKLIEDTARVIQNASFNISNTIKWKSFLAGGLT